MQAGPLHTLRLTPDGKQSGNHKNYFGGYTLSKLLNFAHYEKIGTAISEILFENAKDIEKRYLADDDKVTKVSIGIEFTTEDLVDVKFAMGLGKLEAKRTLNLNQQELPLEG